MHRHSLSSKATLKPRPGFSAATAAKKPPTNPKPEELHRLLAEQAPAAVAMVDTQLRYLCVSRRWLEENNLQQNEIIGKSIYDSLPHLRPLWLAHCHDCLTTGRSAHRDEEPLPRPDGNTDWIKWEIRPWHDRQGIINGLLFLMELVTGHKEQVEKMLLAKKLEATQVLAGGIAHDFNNILAVIAGNIELAQAHTPHPSESHAFLDQATAAVGRASELTRKFITLSPGGIPHKKIAALEEVIQEAVRVALAESDIDCEYSFPQPLPPLPIDRQQMREVFFNLATNAKEAMPHGGKIRIAAAELPGGANSSSLLAAGRFIKIVVQDEGVGIPPQQLDKIFDPYYSTHERGNKKGMGLGLTIVQAIIAKHQGLIEVDSLPGQGTSVVIHLPLEEKERLAIPPVMSKKFPGLRILVMDDEELIRQLAQRMLEMLGCEVTVAATGEEAIRLHGEARQRNRPFQAVILDLTVKDGLGGKETLGHLLPVDPHIRAIVSSGYTMDPAILAAASHGFKSALCKPYTMEELYQAVAKATDA